MPKPRPRRRILFRLVLVLGVGIAGCTPPQPTGTGKPPATPAPSRAPGPSSIVDAWWQAARHEGAVRVYADLSPRETDELGKLFARAHGGVEIEWVRGSDRGMFERAMAEGRDGQPRFDVFVGDIGPRLNAAGLAERWSPPEGSALRPEYADRDGAWHGIAATHYVLQYNTEQVPFGERPTRYEDLADPRYQGRLAALEENLTWLSGLVERQGREATMSQLRPLAAHGITLRRDPPLLSSLVGTGKHGVAIANRLANVERDRRGGAKTGWVGIEPVIVQPTAVVVAATAPRPNGARLVANFLLTADAQALLATLGRVPTRPDVDPEPLTLVRGLRTQLTLPPEGQAERDLRELYAELWRS